MIEMPEHDRKRILEVHQAYLNANASYDWQALRPIWSDDPTNVCFNMVLVRQDGDWKTVHVHFSEARDTPRPGNI